MTRFPSSAFEMRALGPNRMGRSAYAGGPTAGGFAPLQTIAPRPRAGRVQEHPMWQTALLGGAAERGLAAPPPGI